MTLREIGQIVSGTADAAFAVDATGSIVAWNDAAAKLFDRSASKVIGQSCHEVIQGRDEGGKVCCENCIVRQAVQRKRLLKNFDFLVPTGQGERWCNTIVVIAGAQNYKTPYAIHFLRQIDTRKRLELLVQDFVIDRTDLPPEQARKILNHKPSVACQTNLSHRELEILCLLSRGMKTKALASKLNLSAATVNNHIQHILQKTNTHNRLEAVRWAEGAGLI